MTVSHIFHTQLQQIKIGKVNSKTLQENWKTASTRPIKDYNLLADETLSLGKDTKLGWTGYIQTTGNTYRRNFGVTEIGTSQHCFLFIWQELRAWHLLQIAQATISVVYPHQSHNLEPRKLSIYQQSITSDPSMSNHYANRLCQHMWLLYWCLSFDNCFRQDICSEGSNMCSEIILP